MGIDRAPRVSLAVGFDIAQARRDKGERELYYG
jgi:hypothetical protein